MEPQNQDLYVPEHLAIIRESNSIMIRLRWFTWNYALSAILLSVVLFILSPPFVAQAIEQGAWFLLIVVPWFLYVFYFLLTKLINSSYVFINNDIVDVRHKPLPYFANTSISTENISQIQLEQKRYKGKGRRKYFELSALTKEGGTQRLLTYIENEAQAYFIKLEIEKFLKQ